MREANAPVFIDDHRPTTRHVVEMQETTEQRLVRGLEMLAEAREILASVDREMEWHLEARELANQLHEPVTCEIAARYHRERAERVAGTYVEVEL